MYKHITHSKSEFTGEVFHNVSGTTSCWRAPGGYSFCRWKGLALRATGCVPAPCLTAPPFLHSLVNIGGNMENISLASPKHPCCHTFVQFYIWFATGVYEGGPVGFSVPFWLSSWAVIWYITNSSSCEVERTCSVGLRHRCSLSLLRKTCGKAATWSFTVVCRRY